MTEKGHNVSQAAKSLASYVQRIERMEEEKRERATDIKEIYTEAKSTGFDVKVLREVVRRRRKDKADIEAFDATLATYEANLDSILE